jgi:hypothetical protein
MTLAKLFSIISAFFAITSATILYKFSSFAVFGAGYESEETIKEKIEINRKIKNRQKLALLLAATASLLSLVAAFMS